MSIFLAGKVKRKKSGEIEMNKKIIYAILLIAISVGIAYPVIAQNNAVTNAAAANAVDNSAVDVGPTTDVAIPASPGGVVSTDKIPKTPVASSLVLRNTYLNSNYVTAGVGLRNTGRGTVSLRLPSGSTLVAAWVYWKVLNTSAGPHDNEITVNGVRVKGSLLGSGPSPCWATPNGYTYRASISSVLGSTSYYGGEYGIVIGGINSAIFSGVSAWTSFAAPSAEDAQVVIIFKDPLNPTATTTIYDGYTEVSGGSFTASVPVGTTMFSSLIADGQVVGISPTYSKSVSYTNAASTVTLQQVTLNGKDPSITSRATYQGSLSDTDTYILPSVATSGASLTWNLANDCVAYNALIFTNAAAIP